MLIAFLTLALACKKESKAPVCRFAKIASNGGTKYPVIYPGGDTIAIIGEGYSAIPCTLTNKADCFAKKRL